MEKKSLQLLPRKSQFNVMTAYLFFASAILFASAITFSPGSGQEISLWVGLIVSISGAFVAARTQTLARARQRKN